MPLKTSAGNMYPWVTHTHTHLGGQCSHRCSYCYVDSFRGRAPRYQGALRLLRQEFDVAYGEDRTIFVEHMNDLWAEDVPCQYVMAVLDHCAKWPRNRYVFQTKNPVRYERFLAWIPENSLLGCTIETNRDLPWAISRAPRPLARAGAMERICRPKFVTIEPILQFDLGELLNWLRAIRPDFVNVGADSKRHNLPEPSGDEVRALLEGIAAAGIEIREKHNLGRLLTTDHGLQTTAGATTARGATTAEATTAARLRLRDHGTTGV